MIKLLEHTRRPDVSFSRNGTIRITARVARILSLCPGDALNIAITNGEFPCQQAQSGTCSCSAECRRKCNHVEFLLHAVHITNAFSRHEAQCYPSKRGSGNYCANSVRLCRALLDCAGVSADKASFMVGQAIERDGIIYVPIITLHPL